MRPVAALLWAISATCHAAPRPAIDDHLTLTVLPDALATSSGARCLDSSAGAYYTALGSGADATKWVVYLEGGGECESREGCEQRSKGGLGSSRGFKHKIDAFQTGLILGREP